MDKPPQKFDDDSSTALGLGHGSVAQSESAKGGIAVFLDEQMKQLRADLETEMARQGVTDPSKLRLSNEGSTRWVQRRAEKIHAGGKGPCFLDAVAQARKEAETGITVEIDDMTNERRDREYLYGSGENQEPGPNTPEFLMGIKGHRSGGGGAGNRLHFKTRSRKGNEYVTETIQQMGAKPAGGGGGSAGGSERKGTKPICDRCHLQNCTCGVDASEGSQGVDRASGRCRSCKAPKGSCDCFNGRTSTITAHIRKETKDSLKGADVSAGEILEAVLLASARSGQPVAELLRAVHWIP